MSLEDSKSSAAQATASEPGPGVESPATSPESVELGSLLASLPALTPVTPGEIVRGKVLKVTGTEVLVDIGMKSEVALSREEFLTEDGQFKAAPDDLVDIWIEQYDEAAGTISVSHRRAARLRTWEEIERAFREQKTLRGRVLDRIKGGLVVDVGVRAFLPGSHVDFRTHANLDNLLGQEITCKVLKLNAKRSNVVVSRKLALEEESALRKAQLLERLVEGAELTGRVKNLTDYGVFVDLNGMDGLLHITDLSWGRVAHPSEVVQVGQEIKVKILKFDRGKGRISLGLKQLTPDPWERVPSTFRVGDRATGRVVSIADYGAFVELEPGVEGLIHISEMTWSKRLRHPSKLLSVGARAEVVILDLNAAKRRISLSLKQTLPDPWKSLADRLPVGATVQGRVRNLTDFGAFVEIEDGIEGLVHLSNLSWNQTMKHPSEALKKGQKVEAMVLSLDPATRRLSLGLKQLQPDLEKEFFSKTSVGDIVQGKVSRLAPFGAFVQLAEGIEGLCHVSEFLEDPTGEGAKRPEVGGELHFRVIRLNPAEKKIGLSLKEVARLSAPAEVPRPKEPERASTMADALSSAGVSVPEPAAVSKASEPDR